MSKVAVCLSGCGFLDGSEIQETVFTLLALDQAEATAICCAPEMPQAQVVNHATQDRVGDQRDVFTESARIARGNIIPLSRMEARNIDAIIFPGGYGAAQNLSTFAVDGAECTVNYEVETLIADMLEMKKPIGAICIAPAMLARLTGKRGIEANLTIGNDEATATALTKMGAKHTNCEVTEITVDPNHKIVSTPAYMYDATPAKVYEGIKKCVDEVLRLVHA
ncbi:MAG: isoprenoid biosynthesis glyoxalase ElbB [Planctomycetes bacterium]|nr:isoprenoid biosynthesis glyoxalase ElbB [Planctomycetota bacterium]